jgi:hypothetical protein
VLGKCKLDLVGVQEKGGTEWAEGYAVFYGEGNKDHRLGQVFSYVRESFQLLGQYSL